MNDETRRSAETDLRARNLLAAAGLAEDEENYVAALEAVEAVGSSSVKGAVEPLDRRLALGDAADRIARDALGAAADDERLYIVEVERLQRELGAGLDFYDNR